MVYTFEIIGVIFAVAMIYFTYLQYKRKNLTRIGLIFWNIVWIFGSLLIIFNKYTNEILPSLNISRVLDLYMILAFFLIFALIFYLFIIIKRAENKVEKLTRELALKPLKRAKKRK